MRPLNLATQPFRNQRLAQFLLVTAAVVVLGLTAWHAVLIRRVLPGHTSTLHQEVASLEKNAAALRAEGRGLQRSRPPASDMAHWAALKELVDRRSFSWTELFSLLEEVLPDGVRLGSITPRLEKGQVQLDITATARTYEDGIDFIRILEERPEFENVLPLSRGGDEGADFRYSMVYRPSVAPRTAPPSVPTPAAPQPQQVSAVNQ